MLAMPYLRGAWIDDLHTVDLWIRMPVKMVLCARGYGLRRGVIGLHYGLKLRWIRFDSVPVLEWIVITGSLDWAKGERT